MGCKEADMTERLALYFTSSIPDLVPAGFWARVGLSPGTNKLERGFQNDACQNQCPCVKMSFAEWLLAAFMSP